MASKREPLIFAFVISGAATLLVSIAAAEILLGTALVMWLFSRSPSPNLPSFFVPMCVFIVLTLVSLVLSPDPAFNWAFRKTMLFVMSIAAATFATTIWRARFSHSLLLAVATLTSVVGLIQFGIAYIHYLNTQQLGDDPMVLARIRGFMGHWLTYSSEQMLVWCAAIPAVLCLGWRWRVPITAVGAALIMSFTRSVWLGAGAAIGMVAAIMPGRRALIAVLLPLALVTVSASGLIYHRVSMSLNNPLNDFMPDAGRVELWKAGLQMIRDHPWFGVGPEKIAVEFPKIYRGTNLQNIYHGHLENNFLTIAAERGLLCFAAFLWFLLEMYAGLFRLTRLSDASNRWLPVSALSALTGFLVAGCFQYNFGDSEVLLLLLFIVSVPFGVMHERNVEEIG